MADYNSLCPPLPRIPPCPSVTSAFTSPYCLRFSFLPATTLAAADDARVLPEGRLPDDSRLGPLKTLDDYFPFAPSPSITAWQVRAEQVRRQLLVATGLWPLPAKIAAPAIIHGRVDRDGYTVEKVILESYPGFFVTGNLYRPKGKPGRLPGVLCPHGHFTNGRFNEDSVKTVRQEIVDGAERFESAVAIRSKRVASRSREWVASRFNTT